MRTENGTGGCTGLKWLALASALAAGACSPWSGGGHVSESALFVEGENGDLDTETLASDGSVVVIAGPEGGPFPDGERTYRLRNRGRHTVRWYTDSPVPWINFSDTGGTVAGRGYVDLTISINHQVAERLVAGDYPANVYYATPSDPGGYLVLGFLLRIWGAEAGGVLEVSPEEDFRASGDVGGPVTPGEMRYTLSNSGADPLDWSAHVSAPWLVISDPAEGTLAPEASAQVLVSIDQLVVSRFSAGRYEAEISFLNTTDGAGSTTRDVILELGEAGGGRVTAGIVALYDLEEGAGSVVHDVSGVAPPMDLSVSDPSSVTWTSGALSLDSATHVRTMGPASKLYAACTATNEFTIEAWIRTATVSQDGPARIITMTHGGGANFMLGQGRYGGYPQDTFDGRVRSTDYPSGGDGGGPQLTTPSGTVTAELLHVAMTRDAAGAAQIYVNGERQAAATIGGAFSNWNPDGVLCLGNELSVARPWRGAYHLVALYDRALSPTDIDQNYAAGPGDPDVGYLAVTPNTGFTSSGVEGGPFSPLSKTYSLQNPGTATIQWHATLSEPWVVFRDAASGTLNPGQSVSLQVSLHEGSVSGFVPGHYTARLSIENITNGLGSTTRDVILDVRDEGSGDKPGPHNTGPSGDLTPSGSVTASTPGQVVENLNISGIVYVSANNVTIRNCRIDSGFSRSYSIEFASGVSGTVIEDCELTGSQSAAIFSLSGNWTARRCNIHHHQADGVKMRSNTLLEANWIHHLGMAVGAHADCNQTRAGSNILIRGNNLDLPVDISGHASNATSMNGAEVGPIDNMVMEGNWLNGGNYTIYMWGSSYPLTNSRIVNNRFLRGYRYGVLSTGGTYSPDLQITGNVWDDTGELMDINDD